MRRLNFEISCTHYILERARLYVAITVFPMIAGTAFGETVPYQEALQFHLDGSREKMVITDDRSRVKTWKNGREDGPHASQVQPEKRPKRIAEGISGMDAVLFEGGEYLEVPTLKTKQGPVSVFVVSRRPERLASDGKWQRLVSSWVDSTPNDRTLPSWHVYAGSRPLGGPYEPTVDTEFRDDARIGPLAVGANRKNTAGKYRGLIGELLIYDRRFSSPAEKRNVVEYLSDKWNARIVREDMAWVRKGPLGDTPDRNTDALPLSDQDNSENWTVYEPLTDEFEGSSLDSDKWLPRHMHWKGRQPAFFNPENVDVQNGRLHLTMRKQEVPRDLKQKGYHDYSSACVHAKEKVKYGYFEVKARPMNSTGSSSFWFRGPGKEWLTEIDVYEISGGGEGWERSVNMNLHVVRTPESDRHWSVGGTWRAPWKLADDFHVYGLKWTENRVQIYVDGVVVFSVENKYWHQPRYLIFDSETMPDWFGMPKDRDLPSTYDIEYVRAWKKDDQ